MRTLSLVLLVLAACSSNSTSDDDDTVEVISMNCSRAVAEYCATNVCNQTLAAAEQDGRLCPASQITCGEYNVVVKGSGAGLTTFYYKAGALVAVANPTSPTAGNCLGGPTMFDAPRCATNGRSTPACASQEPPTGW